MSFPSMRYHFSSAFLLVLLLIAGCKEPQVAPNPPDRGPLGPDNLAYRWAKVALAATADDTDRFRPRPTVTARMLGLSFTAIFDAWTRYDSIAEPVFLSQVPRRPAPERTRPNKEKAISHAAYGALCAFFFSDSTRFADFMRELGHDPLDLSTDPATPAGIGNLAARTMLDARRHDGSNQYGDIPGSDKPYGDYTGYQPVNTPDLNTNIDRWQPKYFADGKGGRWAPTCLTPYWGRVKTLLIDSAAQFRPGPPPLVGSEQLEKEIAEVVDMSANLSLEQKALVEFMRDGPRSVQQAGHWLMFAQNVSVRDSHDLDTDVKLYFLVTAAAMDAFIAAWDTKRHYDSARPFALAHHYYKGKRIRAWGGPHKGTVEMDGSEWVPYSPETFVCPPFPAYVSGHSCVSGACAKVLEHFTGSDSFGLKLRHLPGYLTEPGITADSVTLNFPTFSSTADQAGLSRVLGGYHIQADNVEGLRLGRSVGDLVWQRYLRHVEGKAVRP